MPSAYGFSDAIPPEQVIAETGSDPDAVQYATLSISAIRDARQNWTANNGIYK